MRNEQINEMIKRTRAKKKKGGQIYTVECARPRINKAEEIKLKQASVLQTPMKKGISLRVVPFARGIFQARAVCIMNEEENARRKRKETHF